MHVTGVAPVEQLAGDDAEDTALLREDLAEARAFLTGQNWCRGIRESYFGCGVGSVVAVFLFRLQPVEGIDEWLWGSPRRRVSR